MSDKLRPPIPTRRLPTPPPKIPTQKQWHLAIIPAIAPPIPPSLTPVLSRIDADLTKYEQAFTPMAKRNLTVALAGLAEAFVKAWKLVRPNQPVPKPVLDLQAATKALGAVPNMTAGRYKSARCIGWAVKTGKFEKVLVEEAGKDKDWLVAYEGDMSDRTDRTNRVGRMIKAIQDAYTLNAGDHFGPSESECLKIFMAPEFFFRGRHGAYLLGAVSQILPDIRTEINQSRYADWLFVLGTAIGASLVEATSCKTCKRTTGFTVVGGKSRCPVHGDTLETVPVGAMIDNVALVQKGGESDDKNTYVVAKEYVSHIDFRRATSGVNPATGRGVMGAWNVDRNIEVLGAKRTVLPPTGSSDVGSQGASKFDDERMGGSIFTIDGIRFGLEICLDHYKKRLDPGDGVKVQLIPSAGASIHHFGCMPGGIAFNVDGGKPHASMRVNEGGKAVDACTGGIYPGASPLGMARVMKIKPLDGGDGTLVKFAQQSLP